MSRDFPGGPVAKSPYTPFAGSKSLIPDWGTISMPQQRPSTAK